MSTTTTGPDSEAIAITGLGLVTPLGAGVAAFAEALGSGRCALREGEELGRLVPTEAGEGRPLLAGSVGDFGARQVIDPQKLRRIPRLGQLCIVAAREALGAGGAAVAQYGSERVGVVLGTGLGSLDQVVEFTQGFLKGGPEAASPALFPTTVMNAAAALVAMELQLCGTNITVNHRELSALEAIATARDQLLCGRAEAILAGSCDELGLWVAHASARFGALHPAEASMRPYDRRRCGLALGEGAAVFLLERLADARARGAQVLAVLSGVGRAGDDRPRVGHLRPGQGLQTGGAALCVQRALAQAGLDGADLDYVAGGGNGTDLDRLETEALRAALGPAADRVRISSLLKQTGESMMSAGLRLASGCLALQLQEVPGTPGCQEPDPEASLPGLRLAPGQAQVRSVLVPTFSQGGGDVALVLRHPSM